MAPGQLCPGMRSETNEVSDLKERMNTSKTKQTSRSKTGAMMRLTATTSTNVLQYCTVLRIRSQGDRSTVKIWSGSSSGCSGVQLFRFHPDSFIHSFIHSFIQTRGNLSINKGQQNPRAVCITTENWVKLYGNYYSKSYTNSRVSKIGISQIKANV